MRVSPSDLRNAISDPSWRPPPTKTGLQDPHSILTKGVKLFHTESPGVALSYVRRTLTSAKWQTSRMKTKSSNAIQAFENYCSRASTDPRPATIVDSAPAITLDEVTVAAPCNVVLMADDGGYVGRLCIWGLAASDMTAAQVELMCVPTVMYLHRELPDDIVHGVDVWFLRTGRSLHASETSVLGRRGELRQILRRLAT
jgi:hypothetical protein